MTPKALADLRELEDVADMLAEALLEQARDQHIYRREKANGPHAGGFPECTALRCETVRKQLAIYRDVRVKP